MRTYGSGVRETRTLSALVIEAIGVVRQDLSEYGFIGLVGAFMAGFTALVLRMIGGSVPVALILPVIGLCAIGTMAASAAAVRRVEDNLDPDAARAFIDALVRAPFLLVPFAPALVLSGLALFLAAEFAENITRWGASALVVALLVLALMNAFQRSMFVPALFSRGISAREAASNARAIHRSAGAAIAMCWAIALLPAGIIALGGLMAGFGTFSTALSAFVFVGSMPFGAAMMSLLYAAAMRSGVATASAPAPMRRGASPVAERLGRHVR
jgi:hypothetical protein